jgi:putative glycosyltransferase (TIGR04348 family)
MPLLTAPTLLVVTPYLAAANNGNWRTATRWARLLSPHYRVIVQSAEAPVTGADRDDAIAMIALHARRSRPAIAAWREARPDRALIVALTGTDLYKDLPAGDADTRASIADADRLIVLQDDARNFVPREDRGKTDVVFQSARALGPWPRKREDRLHCILVAHLRPEKDPATVFAAWRALSAELPIFLTIIGDALDAALGDAACALAAIDPRVRWLGSRPHTRTRQAIKRAHLLLCPSRMEGGANVVVEAITAGTPVIGSRVSGNVGMLGNDYEGYFPVGEAAALAQLLARVWRNPGLHDALASQCLCRSALFTPVAERAALALSLTHALAGRNDATDTVPDRGHGSTRTRPRIIFRPQSRHLRR